MLLPQILETRTSKALANHTDSMERFDPFPKNARRIKLPQKKMNSTTEKCSFNCTVNKETNRGNITNIGNNFTTKGKITQLIGYIARRKRQPNLQLVPFPANQKHTQSRKVGLVTMRAPEETVERVNEPSVKTVQLCLK